eukprot:UN33584
MHTIIDKIEIQSRQDEKVRTLFVFNFLGCKKGIFCCSHHRTKESCTYRG